MAIAAPAAAQQQLGGIQGTDCQSDARRPSRRRRYGHQPRYRSGTNHHDEPVRCVPVYRASSLAATRSSPNSPGSDPRRRPTWWFPLRAALRRELHHASRATSRKRSRSPAWPPISRRRRPTSRPSSTTKKINDLPLVGRNVLSLAALQPGINRHPRHAGLPDGRAGHGRHRERRPRERQQRHDRRRQHQQRALGRHGDHRAERRGGAGIPGDREQPVGRIRAQLRRDRQRDHRGGSRTTSAAASTSSKAPGPARARILRQSIDSQAGLPSQRLWWQRRRSHQEEQQLLLLLDRDRARAHRVDVQPDR